MGMLLGPLRELVHSECSEKKPRRQEWREDEEWFLSQLKRERERLCRRYGRYGVKVNERRFTFLERIRRRLAQKAKEEHVWRRKRYKSLTNYKSERDIYDLVYGLVRAGEVRE